MKTIKRLLPKFVSKKILSYATGELKKKWKIEDQGIKKYELLDKHFQELRALATREELVKQLPSEGIVGEVGVFKGDFSSKILQNSKPRKLHLIDKFNSKEYPSSLRLEVSERFQEKINSGTVALNIGDSVTVAETFEDSYFDWIYIDSDHSYSVTFMELEAYRNKIKDGGFIAGHDFILGNWNDMVRYGVKEAVYEFCVKYNWKLVYITMENKEHPSFAIKRIRI